MHDRALEEHDRAPGKFIAELTFSNNFNGYKASKRLLAILGNEWSIKGGLFELEKVTETN